MQTIINQTVYLYSMKNAQQIIKVYAIYLHDEKTADF